MPSKPPADRPAAETPPRRPSAARADRPGDYDWAGFRASHEAWLGRFPCDAPVYKLPAKLVAVLARGRWIDDEARRAESDLRTLCRLRRIVGFLDGAPIVHPLLFHPSSEPPPDESIRSRRGGPTGGRSRTVPDHSPLRLKGYVGRLLTSPEFLGEFARRKDSWEVAPRGDRPRFPLLRDALAAGPRREAADEFAASFVAFCDRWALDGAASWDLPLPRAVALGGPPAVDPAAVTGVHLFLPFHQPLDDELLRRIRRMQEEQARILGIGNAAAGPSHYKAFARILEVVHLDRTASGRYRAPGFVECLVRGLATSLDLSGHQVDKWRRAASALRRGAAPSSIAALRTRS